jgi:hypothetical protein
MVGLAALLYAIIEAPINGWTSPTTLLGFAVFVVGIGAFIAWELRTDHPMLPMTFFRNRRFSVGATTITLTFFTMFGLFFVLTQYLQFVQGYSPLAAGVATLPLAVMMIVVAPRSAGFVDRFGQHNVQAVVLGLLASGLVVLALLTPTSSYAVVAVGLAIVGAGVACTTAPATNAIIGSVPLAKAGVGSAVNDTTREVGGALGIAVLGSIMSSTFRSDGRPGRDGAGGGRRWPGLGRRRVRRGGAPGRGPRALVRASVATPTPSARCWRRRPWRCSPGSSCTSCSPAARRRPGPAARSRTGPPRTRDRQWTRDGPRGPDVVGRGAGSGLTRERRRRRRRPSGRDRGDRVDRACVDPGRPCSAHRRPAHRVGLGQVTIGPCPPVERGEDHHLPALARAVRPRLRRRRCGGRPVPVRHGLADR